MIEFLDELVVVFVNIRMVVFLLHVLNTVAGRIDDNDVFKSQSGKGGANALQVQSNEVAGPAGLLVDPVPMHGGVEPQGFLDVLVVRVVEDIQSHPRVDVVLGADVLLVADMVDSARGRRRGARKSVAVRFHAHSILVWSSQLYASRFYAVLPPRDHFLPIPNFVGEKRRRTLLLRQFPLRNRLVVGFCLRPVGVDVPRILDDFSHAAGDIFRGAQDIFLRHRVLGEKLLHFVRPDIQLIRGVHVRESTDRHKVQFRQTARKNEPHNVAFVVALDDLVHSMRRRVQHYRLVRFRHSLQSGRIQYMELDFSRGDNVAATLFHLFFFPKRLC